MFMYSESGAVQNARRKCRRKFLKFFPGGFHDETYIDWERDYKWQAHVEWEENLNETEFASLLRQKKYAEIAKRAAAIEGRTNLLFSFEKMALRDAVKSKSGAKQFAEGLFAYIYGKETLKKRFEVFVEVVSKLPRKQTRVLTWPLVTVFGFIARPKEFIFLKPRVTQTAAAAYRFDFAYASRPNWETYRSMLDFAQQVKKDTADLKPRDMIDLQSFIWVMGSDEY